MAGSAQTISTLEEKLLEKEEEVEKMVESVEQVKILELERKELVVVLQEKEEVEAGLRRQVAELQEMLKEQGSSRQSLVANLEAARQEVEAAMLQRTRLEAEMKEKSALVEEVTKTATVRLEKCKVVELELEESVRAQKELGVKMISLDAALEQKESEARALREAVKATEDNLEARIQENALLQAQLEELKTKHSNDLNAEKLMIQQQFETMTKNFESQTKDLEHQLKCKEMEVAEKEKEVEEEQEKLKSAEEKRSELENNCAEATDELRCTKTELESAIKEHVCIQEAIARIEEEKSDLEKQLKVVKASMVTQEKHESVKALLTSTLDEVDQLKLENTKTKSLEKEAEDLKKAKTKAETVAQHSQKKQASLQTSVGRLNKQLGDLKEVVAKYEEETAKASSSPWESEDWEGLTSSEKWDMMHQDLVPLQQARLLKLCQKELEADLCTSKSDFLRAVADFNSIKEEKTKLKAKICILESRDLSKGKKQDRDGKEKIEAPRPVVAPAKFTAPEPVREKPASKRNLRRSSRSASAVASVLLSTMEEMKEEQEKKDKVVETKKEKAVVGQIPAGDKKGRRCLQSERSRARKRRRKV